MMKTKEGKVLIFETEVVLSKFVEKITSADITEIAYADVVLVINPVTQTTHVIKNRYGVLGKVGA